MFRLRFTTLVEAPLTVAFDVARVLGRPWTAPLREVESQRPSSDVYTGGAPGLGISWDTEASLSPTTLVDGRAATGPGEIMIDTNAAEETGYRRVWYAEHHNMAAIASSATSVLIAHVAAHTSTIRRARSSRVGAGRPARTSHMTSAAGSGSSAPHRHTPPGPRAWIETVTKSGRTLITSA